MASKKKRGREDEETWEVDEALHQLQGTLDRDFQHKLRALDKIIALIDPSDEQYSVQRLLVDGDAAFYITELLADPTAGAKAAEAVAALCRHSAPVFARLSAGPLVGLDSSVERVHLNPCQSDFVDSGAVAALVPLALGRQEGPREAAAEAIAALCSYHQEGKLAYLEALVAAVQQQQTEALELLDGLVDGMECGGEPASQQLDLLQQSLIAELRAGPGRPTARAAVSLLGTLCEKRPEAAAELRCSGVVESAARHLLQGSQDVQDVAARAVWLLVKDERSCLAGEGCLLGCDAVALAKVLVQLLEAAEAEEARVEDEYAQGGSADAASASAGAAFDGEQAPAADICYAEEASALLKALAAAHPAVEELVWEREVRVVRGGSQRCCIM